MLLVHGYNVTGRSDCAKMWGNAAGYLRTSGWTGEVRTFGYYPGARGQTATTNTSITDIARVLARTIHDNYTVHGQAVDVIAHSMGGLVLRAAIAGVQNHQAGFPHELYEANAVTP